MRHFPGLCSKRTEKMIADSGKKRMAAQVSAKK